MTGEELRLIRKTLHLTALGMAKEMGVTNVTVSSWERGVNKVNEQAILNFLEAHIAKTREVIENIKNNKKSLDN